MARWVALAVTLLCMFSCSFISTNPVRGVLAPFGVFIGSFLTLFLFVQHRVSGASRRHSIASLDAEAQILLRRHAERKREEAAKAEADAVGRGSGSPAP